MISVIISVKTASRSPPSSFHRQTFVAGPSEGRATLPTERTANVQTLESRSHGDAGGDRRSASSTRRAYRDRTHGSGRGSAFQERQDHRARSPDAIGRELLEMGVLDVVNSGLGQVVVVNEEWQIRRSIGLGRGFTLELALCDRVDEASVSPTDTIRFSSRRNTASTASPGALV